MVKQEIIYAQLLVGSKDPQMTLRWVQLSEHEDYDRLFSVKTSMNCSTFIHLLLLLLDKYFCQRPFVMLLIATLHSK